MRNESYFLLKQLKKKAAAMPASGGQVKMPEAMPGSVAAMSQQQAESQNQQAVDQATQAQVTAEQQAQAYKKEMESMQKGVQDLQNRLNKAESELMASNAKQEAMKGFTERTTAPAINKQLERLKSRVGGLAKMANRLQSTVESRPAVPAKAAPPAGAAQKPAPAVYKPEGGFDSFSNSTAMSEAYAGHGGSRAMSPEAKAHYNKLLQQDTAQAKQNTAEIESIQQDIANGSTGARRLRSYMLNNQELNPDLQYDENAGVFDNMGRWFKRKAHKALGTPMDYLTDTVLSPTNRGYTRFGEAGDHFNKSFLQSAGGAREMYRGLFGGGSTKDFMKGWNTFTGARNEAKAGLGDVFRGAGNIGNAGLQASQFINPAALGIGVTTNYMLDNPGSKTVDPNASNLAGSFDGTSGSLPSGGAQTPSQPAPTPWGPGSATYLNRMGGYANPHLFNNSQFQTGNQGYGAPILDMASQMLMPALMGQPNHSLFQGGGYNTGGGYADAMSQSSQRLGRLYPMY